MKLVRAGELPLPGAVRWIGDVPGEYVTEFPYGRTEGGLWLIQREEGKHYPEFYLWKVGAGLNERVGYGGQHKALIRASGRGDDLLPGGGVIAEMVREIHAIERGILTLEGIRGVPGRKRWQVRPRRNVRMW